MKDGPDIARLAALIGDPARANILTGLMSGKALTASELAAEAGITAATVSAHVARLKEGGLIRMRKQGRHRYVALADDDVAHVLETLMGLAQKRGHTRVRTGPRDADLRKARVCYNHLAGEFGVQMFDSCRQRGFISETDEQVILTDLGRARFTDFGVNLDDLGRSRRPLCRPCLDWSARRSHLAGSLGVALLNRVFDLGWARRRTDTRVVAFTKSGEQQFHNAFPLTEGAAPD